MVLVFAQYIGEHIGWYRRWIFYKLHKSDMNVKGYLIRYIQTGVFAARILVDAILIGWPQVKFIDIYNAYSYARDSTCVFS